MSSPTPYLDGLILASAVYPSGFGHALFTLRRGAPRRVSAAFLGFLALPFAALALAVGWARPELLALRAAAPGWLLAALLAAPLALGIEYRIHAFVASRVTGHRPRGVALEPFWGRGLSPPEHLLLAAVAVGEELAYRRLWLGILMGSCGLPVAAALGVGALVYGLNHLVFGPVTVASKTAVGLLYGGLYLAAGESLGPPVVAHLAQNLLLFGLAGRGRG